MIGFVQYQIILDSGGRLVSLLYYSNWDCAESYIAQLITLLISRLNADAYILMCVIEG